MPIQVQLVAQPLVSWGLERLVESAQPALEVVGVAASVAQYLVAPRQFAPDVLVLDLDGEDGIKPLTDLHSQTQAKILVVTGASDMARHDEAVLAGARGVVDKRDSAAAAMLLKAIARVHEGEIWIDRTATSRIFLELVRKKAATQKDPEQQKIANLTRREYQTIAFLAGAPSAPGKLLAEKLHISEHTLRNHLTSIYSKLGLTNRVELYAFAQRHGLTSDE